MALVKTQGPQEPFNISGADGLVRQLRAALADECGAANLYSQLIDSIETDRETIDQLTEIYRDELEHAGKLIALIAKLDPESAEHYRTGSNEPPADTTVINGNTYVLVGGSTGGGA